MEFFLLRLSIVYSSCIYNAIDFDQRYFAYYRYIYVELNIRVKTKHIHAHIPQTNRKIRSMTFRALAYYLYHCVVSFMDIVVNEIICFLACDLFVPCTFRMAFVKGNSFELIFFLFFSIFYFASEHSCLTFLSRSQKHFLL